MPNLFPLLKHREEPDHPAGRAVRRATLHNLQDFPEDAHMTRRVILSGATGFIGRVDRLHERLDVAAAIALADGLAETAAWYRDGGRLKPSAR